MAKLRYGPGVCTYLKRHLKIIKASWSSGRCYYHLEESFEVCQGKKATQAVHITTESLLLSSSPWGGKSRYLRPLIRAPCNNECMHVAKRPPRLIKSLSKSFCSL